MSSKKAFDLHRNRNEFILMNYFLEYSRFEINKINPFSKRNSHQTICRQSQQTINNKQQTTNAE